MMSHAACMCESADVHLDVQRLILLFSYYVREMGDPNKRKPYLPAEKQYLITRNGIICFTIFSTVNVNLLFG